MGTVRRIYAAVALVSAVSVLVGCGDDGLASRDTSARGPAADTSADDDHELAGTITVFAAASLTDAFSDVADAFEAAHPGATVELSFGGSSSLREQILDGAPADVFASANESNMEQVEAAGEVEGSRTFATNAIEIAVPAGNPAGVTGLEDLGDPDLLIGLCAEEVPCGDFGRQALEAAGVTPAPDTNEPDVRSLLTKVEAGELDAGLVYVSDVVSAGDGVEGIPVPREDNVVATYPIGTVATSDHPQIAEAFVAFVLSEDGQAILERHGFGRP